MDVAVIIPLFNGSQWIRQTLESVFSPAILILKKNQIKFSYLNREIV
jgi:hypothetical protein